MVVARPHRARIVHAIGAAQLVAWGATFYAIPPLLPQISAELDVSLATLSIAITAGLCVNAVLSLAVAAWIHRCGARLPMLAGSLVAFAALVALAISPAAPVAFAALALLGAAHAALLYEPAFAAVSTLTPDPIERTRAIQIITFWGGWAALWALPAASILGDRIGWRATLVLLAALLAAASFRGYATLPRRTFRRASPPSGRSAISVGLAFAFALAAIATTGVVVNGVLLLSDRNLSLASASWVFALLAPVQVLGRVWFMRRNGVLTRHDGWIPFALVGAGVIALLAAPSTPALVLFVVLFGAGAGLLTTIRAAVVLRLSPRDGVVQLGAYSFITSAARAFAPALSSSLHIALGYELALGVLAAMALVASMLVWRATNDLS